MIRLEHICKTFPGKGGAVEAVKDVSLTVEDGEIYGIIGFSGAGKSTLVRCINLLERPDSGRVFLDGSELTSLGPAEIRRCRRQMGMIFQQFNLFASRTVYENVAFPLRGMRLPKEKLDARMRELLEQVGLSGRGNAYPSELSGGQKQRVAIARALAGNPKVLLCDEATSALDPKTTRAILRLIKDLSQRLGITVVLITHEMQVIKEICDRVAVLENGIVVEEGEVFPVFANPKQAVTRGFIEVNSGEAKIGELLAENAPITKLCPGECILKLSYGGDTAGEAVVSQLSRRFGVDLNIIFGDIEIIGSRPLGTLIVVARAASGDIEQALAYLKTIHVGVEVIADARVPA